MYIALAITFVLGYTAIALEHPLKLDKAASALFTAAVCWILLSIGRESFLQLEGHEATEMMTHQLMEHLGDIGGILFFLLGAMTIVELVDAHGGFKIVTDRIATSDKGRLLVILSIVTFFMSAVLDNLTTSIVMATVLRKVIKDKQDLWMFAGMIIIAANAGGAWSPIGDVTTIMLWIGGQVSTVKIIVNLILPSLVCMAVPLIILNRRMAGQRVNTASPGSEEVQSDIPIAERKLVLFMGIGALLFVPVLKSLTHLPPFIGILFGLSVLWATVELLHRKKAHDTRKSLSIGKILERVDTPSILFFLGILLAVAALQSVGMLADLARGLDDHIGNIWVINLLIGLLSSVVDNVPLVAGAMGMYDIQMYSQDNLFWHLLAYCAGTGGSCLIIGSAAGVAIMGILKIDFIWYLKKISLLALSGYLSGALVFWLLQTYVQV